MPATKQEDERQRVAEIVPDHQCLATSQHHCTQKRWHASHLQNTGTELSDSASGAERSRPPCSAFRNDLYAASGRSTVPVSFALGAAWRLSADGGPGCSLLHNPLQYSRCRPRMSCDKNSESGHQSEYQTLSNTSSVIMQGCCNGF